MKKIGALVFSTHALQTPKPHFEPRRDAPRPSGPSAFTPARRDLNAMDVDTARQEARAKGLCYKCKEPGHRFFKCPNKKVFATRKVEIQSMTMEEWAKLLAQLQGFQEGQE